MYASSNECFDNGLFSQVIPSLVNHLDNVMLTNIPSLEEVKTAVFAMGGNSSLGPDGFGGSFYHSFWDVVSLDVFNSCLQFFITGSVYPNMNSNLIVLIPKIKGVDRIENFRPIASANF